MARNKIIESLLFYPASVLYGLGVSIRNYLFSCGILKSQTFDIPIISVGNLAVGGTGKTPHTEMIIQMLKSKYNVGVLSRGYGRKTRGFRLLDATATPRNSGDEPYQMYLKYGGSVTFAVCEKRTEGIKRMREANPKLQVIVLDDAFQHQYVKPSLSIVLTEFNRPVFYDKLLPLGRLREPVSGLNRCDAVIVTKCPQNLKPIEYRIFINKLNLFPYQKLFFSHLVYGMPKALFPASTYGYLSLDELSERDAILSVTGIANPRPFVIYLRKHQATVKVKTFGDHHNFTTSDFEIIKEKFNNLQGEHKYIFTTEKDAVKIINNPHFPAELKPYIFYIPINVSIEDNEDGTFADYLIKHIARNYSAVALPFNPRLKYAVKCW